VSNKDEKMLEELYDANFTGLWEKRHMVKLIQLIDSANWAAGRQVFFKSFTTEVIMQSLPVDEKMQVVQDEIINNRDPV